MTIKEPENQVKIQPTDIVSGRLYLKLIEEYKEYDKQQKEYISQLELRISTLQQALDDAITGDALKISRRLERSKKKIKNLKESIKSLKSKNGQLLLENIRLKNKINNKMCKSGFLCPKCKSWDTEYVGSTEIECNICGHIWDPGDDDDDDDNELCCPRCGCDDLDIYDNGEFTCNGCGLEGDVDNLD